MRKIKRELILVCFLTVLVLSGCSRSGEILYFDREAAGDGASRGHIDGQPEENPPGGELEAAADTRGQICVHVCGQVRQPGVVMLPEGSRAWEAVEAAGGLSDEAEQAAVNLAALLRDGERLYVPSVDEEIPALEGAGDGRINLNTADAAGLQTLPGIGESRAADILAYREKHGGFGSVEEIMQVPGIKESIYEKIKDKITAD